MKWAKQKCAGFLAMIAILSFAEVDSENISSTSPGFENKQGSESIVVKVPRCCPINTSYRQYLDVCSSAVEKDKLPRNEIVNIRLPSAEWITIQFLNASAMMLCPNGTIGTISNAFQFTNTSLQLQTSDGFFEPSNYCMDEHLENNSSLFVRYCIPDPCYENEKICIKKCCPPGKVMNYYSRFCESKTKDDNILSVVKDESGALLASSDAYNESFVVVSGHGLKCAEGHIYFGVNDNNIRLINGSYLNPLKIIDADNTTFEYCIDYVNTKSAADGFKALACMKEVPYLTPTATRALQIYPYFQIVSIIFLVLTLVVYLLLPELRSKLNGVLIMCYICILIALYTTLVVLAIFAPTMPDVPCIMSAVVLQFSALAAFSWLNIISLDIWQAFSNMKPRGRGDPELLQKFALYSIYGWGVPMVIVLVGQILDNVAELPENVIRPNFGKLSCWFYTHPNSTKPMEEPIFYYYHAPICLMVLVNLVFLIMTIRCIYQVNSEASVATNHSSSSQSRTGQRLKVMLTLIILKGIPWISEVITFYTNAPFYISFIPDLINVLNGVFIFLLFVCKANVINLLKKKFSMCGGCFKTFSLAKLNTFVLWEKTNTSSANATNGPSR